MTSEPAPPGPPPSRLRVVLADDNADLVLALGDVIDAEPGLACAARVGAADRVVPVVRAADAQAVVLDLRLPGATGFEVLDRLRRELPHVHVVVFSGHARPELEHEALRRGAAAYVVKTGDVDALLAHLHALRDSRMT